MIHRRHNSHSSSSQESPVPYPQGAWLPGDSRGNHNPVSDRRCLPNLFESAAQKSPDSVAVTFEAEVLTYVELNQRANQLAHYLHHFGVGPEITVGICLKRSLHMAVAILGILKAGGAYVPLDPAYPSSRLAFMVQDAKVGVLVTHTGLLEQLPASEAKVICLDKDAHTISQLPSFNQRPSLLPDHPAYIIFTSGSTGRPKGVAMSHRSLVNLIDWQHQSTCLPQPARTLQFASLSFDVSCQEMFFTWDSGGTLVLIAEEVRQDAITLLDVLDQRAVERLFLPFVALQHLAQAAEGSSVKVPKVLREVITAGEQLQITPSIQSFFSRIPGCVLHNQYGPTESHVVTAFTLDGEPITWPTLPPIGSPIANTVVYVLDSDLQAMPAEAVGELYLGGEALARGYLHHPDLTAERFVPDPFATQPGARLYKTGDLARLRPDGNVEFLGRADQQVKIRGYRIEFGEIEASLGRHPAIKEVAVTAIQNQSEGHSKRLVAYVVLRDGQRPFQAELRRFLADALPEYMVPSLFVFIPTLPLTPSGKVDRRALPTPERSRPTSQTEFIPPRNPAEIQMTHIWEEVLQLEGIGMEDNFFELGGHSLIAMQVLSRLRVVFQVDISLRQFFACATIAKLVHAIQTIGKSGEAADLPLPCAPRPGQLPLSFTQQRLWFLNLLSPQSAAYNIPEAWRLHGSLNLPVLKESIESLVERHESLRTTFKTLDGEPFQAIHSTLAVAMSVLDLRKFPAAEREAEANRLIQAEARRPFDFVQGPLLRVMVVQLDEEDHLLLITMHHIISDGWSLGLLREELRDLYNARLAGRPSPLADLSLQFADFAIWQRQWLQDDRLAIQLNYWQQQLNQHALVLDLPRDRPRPSVQGFRGARMNWGLSKEATQGLKALSRQESATLFITLLAAFQAWLARITGQADIAVGTPVAGRTQPALEWLIGFFVNTLVLRTDTSGNPTFRELLRRVREVALMAYDYQDVPFEKLVEVLQPERDLSHSPLFQVMLVLEPVPARSLGLTGVTSQPVAVDTGTSKFDLTLFVWETEAGLEGMVEYDLDLFELQTIARLLKQFQTLLHGILADPDQRLSELSLLTAAERQQLLVEWNLTDHVYSRERCLPELFEAQVERTPEATAIRTHAPDGTMEKLTYAELNRRANQLAHSLQKQGVGPNVPVGICLERSLDLIIGLLGVLKAGGCYVPLDPGYPVERLAFMIEEARIKVLVTKSRGPGARDWGLAGAKDQGPKAKDQSQIADHASQVTNRQPLTTIFLDTDWLLISQSSISNPQSAISPDDLLYIIFTSGSTGRPKGAGVYQRGFVNLLEWYIREFQISSDDRVLLVSSPSFDLTQKNIFAPLVTGGELHILATDYYDPARLSTAIEAGRITFINCAPSAFYPLVEEVGPGAWQRLNTLRGVCLGGEPINFSRLKGWLTSEACHAEISNTYGPTECTDISACYQVREPKQFQDQTVPIGKPIANVRVYVLDEYLEPVPMGVPGEVCVAGVGVGLGYVNDAVRTAEKFIPNPFVIKEGGTTNDLHRPPSTVLRLYRTGDLARWLPDGNLEFLGRLDHQVKVRGFRIELGEIEASLKQHPAVREVLIISESTENDQSAQLIAYIIPARGETVILNDLRLFLRERLPEYMMPSAWVVLDAFPLTANGKIDRQALPKPEQITVRGGEAPAAPSTPYEEILLDIWKEVLRREWLGVHDNFFTLGGHSLLATRILSRVHDRFEVDLPVRTVFEAPTIAEMALWIERELVVQVRALASASKA